MRFPRRDVKGPPLAVEVVFESNGRAELESLGSQLLVKSVQSLEANGRRNHKESAQR